jgi:hypothetical protein
MGSDPRIVTETAIPFTFCCDVVTHPSQGLRPTCRESRNLLEHPRKRFFPCGLDASDNTPGIHLDDALRRRLPVALVSWAGRPSEGRALLGGVRDVPLLRYSRAPVVTGWSSVGSGESPTSESEPIETLVQKPSREGEPCPEDQGAFHRQQPAGTRGLLHTPVLGRSPLTPSLRKGHCEAPRPPFPVEQTSLGFLCLGWGARAPL